MQPGGVNFKIKLRLFTNRVFSFRHPRSLKASDCKDIEIILYILWRGISSLKQQFSNPTGISSVIIKCFNVLGIK